MRVNSEFRRPHVPNWRLREQNRLRILRVRRRACFPGNNFDDTAIAALTETSEAIYPPFWGLRTQKCDIFIMD
jgi:hypothetical protein